jgi:hypothetical protein
MYSTFRVATSRQVPMHASLCMTMLTRTKYVFHGEATINLKTTFISDRYFQFDTTDATTTIDDIEVIPTRTAVVEASKRRSGTRGSFQSSQNKQ